MNLAYKYPIIYWNTANLIIDSKGIYAEEEDEDEDELEVVEEEADENEEDEAETEEEEEEEGKKTGGSKSKNKSVDYDKVATAIGKFKTFGIEVAPPNVNSSTFTFTPVEETNTILYGLRGITGINSELAEEIIRKRPYNSIQEFLDKIKINKPKMVSLIKSGAFDGIGGLSREEIMMQYMASICDKKETVNLRNMGMLIDKDVLPEEMTQYIKLFLFNKYLKKFSDGTYYNLSEESAVNFIINNFDADYLSEGDKILVKTWDKLYKKGIVPLQQYIKEHVQEITDKLNEENAREIYDKYASGNLSKWEMESLSFYSHPHELDYATFAFDNFFNLDEQPIIEKSFETRTGETVNMFKLSLIAGTVIARNKTKNTISLLTQYGVVDVKIYKEQFALYDKRISQILPDGKKKVIEESWFKRGNLLIIQGIRRGNNFIPKKYKSSHIKFVISKITNIDNKGHIEFQEERAEAE